MNWAQLDPNVSGGAVLGATVLGALVVSVIGALVSEWIDRSGERQLHKERMKKLEIELAKARRSEK